MNFKTHAPALREGTTLQPNIHIFNPIKGVRVLEEARNLLLGDVKAIFRIVKSNLGALNTDGLGPKRPFSVGECAL
jgi:hypothetical protein